MAESWCGSATNHPRNTNLLRVLVATGLAAALVALPAGVTASGDGVAPQDPYAHDLPAPVLAFGGSDDGQHVAVMDEDARFTFLLDAGDRERSWTPPSSGNLGIADPALAEQEPTAVGVTMTPDGDHWAGATAYSGQFGGRVDGFAHWSDEPIWTYELPDGDMGEPGVQPTVLASGGSVHAVGTTAGKVHVLLADGDEGSDKQSIKTYSKSNTGVPFGSITDLAINRDGTRFLIGTATSGAPSLHLYTDIFFKATFKRVTEPVKQVALSADGTRGAAATGSGENARVHFLDTATGKTIWEHTVSSTVRSLALSEDGTLLAVGLANGRALLFEERGTIMDGEPRRTLTLGSAVTSVAASDDGFTAVASTSNGKVHMLDLRRESALWSFTVPAPAVDVWISGDQEMVVVASAAGEQGRITYLEAKHELEHLVPTMPRLLPGKTQQIAVELANNGNRMETVHVEWTSLPDNWQGGSSNITLAPGETGTLGAVLTLPPGQAKGDYEIAFDLVTANQRIPVERDSRVPEVTSGQAVQVWSFERAVPGGAPAAFLVKLQNTGNTVNELALGYSGLPLDWTAEFSGPRETKLRPGEDRQVAFMVHAPTGAQVGDEAWPELVIAWQHGEERHPLRVEVVDHSTYTFQLYSISDTNDLPDEEGMSSLLERLNEEAQSEPESQSEEQEKSVLIPLGGLAVPLGAVAAAAAVALLVARRASRPTSRRARPERAEVRLKRP